MLRITKTDAQIGIETRKAQVEMNSRTAKLNIQQNPGKVEQTSELPKVQIDQYQCFAEAGRKNNMDLMLEIKQLAEQRAAEYTAKVVSDGNSLAAIENKSNPIPGFAERDAYPEHEFGMVTMPQSRPKIEVTGDLKFNVEKSSVDIEFEPNKLDVQVTPHEVNIYLKQKPSLQIEYLGEKVDTKI